MNIDWKRVLDTALHDYGGTMVIPVVKAVRDGSGVGLIEAKDAVMKAIADGVLCRDENQVSLPTLPEPVTTIPNAFTPPPWHINEGRTGISIEYEADYRFENGHAANNPTKVTPQNAPSGRCVAFIPFKRSGAKRGEAARYFKSTIDEGNARLICAAPAMAALVRKEYESMKRHEPFLNVAALKKLAAYEAVMADASLIAKPVAGEGQ